MGPGDLTGLIDAVLAGAPETEIRDLAILALPARKFTPTAADDAVRASRGDLEAALRVQGLLGDDWFVRCLAQSPSGCWTCALARKGDGGKAASRCAKRKTMAEAILIASLEAMRCVALGL